jgi:hypothetical protein
MKNTGKKAIALSKHKQTAQPLKSKKKIKAQGFTLRTDVFSFLGIFITNTQQVTLAENMMEECAV